MEVLKDGIPDEAFKSSEYAINQLFRIFDALDRHKGQIVLAARGLDKTVMRALTPKLCAQFDFWWLRVSFGSHCFCLSSQLVIAV
jgi:hypothetical protein